MSIASHTLGPLHLEDLEPHRFEDLIRQLLYDFRPWKQLEATGRSGSDDGFDARGFEVINSEPKDDDLDEPSEEIATARPDRQWLVQCKREKSIGPAKLQKYLNEIDKEELKGLYGIIFVAACDFSKKARDIFRETVRNLGIDEAYLWGKAEIEDQLFQPKNDHLLFAYTGISLKTRQRSLKTQVRANLTIKRKAHKVLKQGQPLLLKDPSDDRFPYLNADEKLDRFDRGRWVVRDFRELAHNGLLITTHRFFAYVDDDNKSWDYCDWINDARSDQYRDHWDGYDFSRSKRGEIHRIWLDLPEQNRAWYEIYCLLPFENIIAIDEIPDGTWSHGPQVLTSTYEKEFGPFIKPSWGIIERLGGNSHISVAPVLNNRIDVFPKEPETEESES